MKSQHSLTTTRNNILFIFVAGVPDASGSDLDDAFKVLDIMSTQVSMRADVNLSGPSLTASESSFFCVQATMTPRLHRSSQASQPKQV